MNEASEFPRTLAGRYRLEGLLGQGGMGMVYRAVDTTMQRPVAIKLIAPDPSAEDDAVTRFMREARNTARITHPHIVHLYDLGRGEAGELFFVMELLGGESLSELLRREGRLSVDQAVHVARQICAALGYAHKKGVVHRDLKPGNIMVLERGGDPSFVKVLDFGVAKAQDQGTQITKTGMVIGTVDYMAPEQIIGRTLDPRTDIYSLGILLYRMITGSLVFPEGSLALVVKHQVSSLPESMRARAGDVALSDELDAVVLRCLAKAPDDRFASMDELDAALVRALRAPRKLSPVSRETPPARIPTRPPAPAVQRPTMRESRPSFEREADVQPVDFDDLSAMVTLRADPPSARSAQVPVHRTDPGSETKLAVPRRASPSMAGVASERAPASGGVASERPVSSRAPSGTHVPVSSRAPSGAHVPPAAESEGRLPSGDFQMLAHERAPASLPQAPAPSSSASRWLGLLAPVVPAIYLALFYDTQRNLGFAMLGGSLVIGGLLFFWGVGRSRR